MRKMGVLVYIFCEYSFMREYYSFLFIGVNKKVQSHKTDPAP
jgi:hypothetical protein